MINKRTLTKVAKDHGFEFICIANNEIAKNQNCALFEQSTPNGEDWCIEFNYKKTSDLVNEIIKYGENYDAVDDAVYYIDNRGNYGIPTDIKDLIEDADWKNIVFKNLINDLKERNK